MGFARIHGAQAALPSAHIVTVEADLSRGLHAFAIVGLPDKAVEEARDRVASAIKNSGFTSPKSTNRKIVVSLAPAALKKEGAAFDLPVALSYLQAADEISCDQSECLFAGELSLDGTVRPIRGALAIALAARENGCRNVFVPKANAREAALVTGIRVFGVSSLRELIDHLTDDERDVLPEAPPTETASAPVSSSALESIRGQEHAKRALEIAAAGRHNLALFGPPGTGKTMLARALRDILPNLSDSELLEATAIHSFAGALDEAVVTRPPFRAPHHSASHVSLVGGGTIPRPGEVTLAHHGVLFLDEFPEFTRDCINALRQPLEDRLVSVTRAQGSSTFPANFTLVVALNPCPCGHFGTTRCTCLPAHIERYRRKISGPIADRIDMWVMVADIDPETLGPTDAAPTGATEQARVNVEQARERQLKRLRATDANTNSDMQPSDIEHYASLTDVAQQTLVDAANTLNLSPRGYHRTIKLARTIADLAGCEYIENEHMLEALQYRPRTW